MKEWLGKIKGMKGIPWLALLLCCALALILWPSASGQFSSMTEEEQRVSATLSRIAGAGETHVSIYYAQAASTFGNTARTPVGAVVVARGAGDVEVRLKLTQAVETLLGLAASQVDVFPMEETP